MTSRLLMWYAFIAYNMLKAMMKRVSFLNFYREFPEAERDEERLAENGF